MIEVGKKYFFLAHAYHHYIGEVVEVSPRWAKVKNCVKVMGDSRGWEKALFGGYSREMSIQHCPDGTLIPIGTMPIHPWNHEIPKRSGV